ncbi:hypothetical protein BsWGS_24006 [Bradybaena similaris]
MGLDPEIACGIVGNIGQLWLDGQFNDLQIHVGDFLFDCNRFILCACSKFFQVLLKSEVKGESEHPIRQVTIRGISPEIFQLVLKAVYQGEDGLSTENMIEFWHAVHQLEIPVLISKCEIFLISHMIPENFVNIYQNALFLKSINMIKMAHHFVAKNFERFQRLDILLQQPASYIEEIIGSDILVGQSQNHVEFILKWVNYELCASEANPVSADSTVGDLSAQTNEVRTNRHTSVEVIFQKHDATFGKGLIRNMSGHNFVRKQFLGKLLKLVRFTGISKANLEILADNDLVMGCKETRDIIKQAQKLVNSAPTSAAPTSDPSMDTEDTVVFVTCDIDSTVYAYCLDRQNIFEFYQFGSKILNIHTHDNKLLCHTLYNLRCIDSYMLEMVEFPFSETLQVPSVRNDSVVVGDFCYTFKEDKYMYKITTENNGIWHQLFALPKHMPSPSLAAVNDSILYYNSTLDGRVKQEVYCFNTESRRHWLLMTCEFTDCDFVTFKHNDQLYILYGNGVPVNITNSVISPVKAITLPQYSIIPKHRLLWEFQFKIYGAVVHQNNLIVFGDLTSILVSEIRKCKIPGLKAIKFIHLHGLVTKCHPLVIPKELLTRRM